MNEAMEESVCPNCGEVLPTEAINIAEGVALCGQCGKLSRLSAVMERSRPTHEILAQPPRGCSINSWGDEIRIDVSQRSMVGFVGSLAFCLFWNGIVSVFVMLALSGLYINLVGPLPAWVPAPEFKDPMPLGMALFLCVFLIPFVLVGSVMLLTMLTCAFGHIQVRLNRDSAYVRTAIGPFGWRRNFDPRQVRRVGFTESAWHNESKKQPSRLVEIEADTTIQVGQVLPANRVEWLQAILHALLVYPGFDRRADLLASGGPS